MKITLILAAAPDDPLRQNDPFMPLSLPLVAGAAPDHDYTFVDMLGGEEPDFDQPAELVGISARLTAEKTAYRLAAEYRRRGVPVVLGGPQISSVPLRAVEHADAVAVGEGEVLWPLILEDLAAGELKELYVASPTPFDADGHSLRQVDAFLDLERVRPPQRQHYRRSYVFDTVFAARGCAIGCDFCSVPTLHGKHTRLRPVDDVVAEIDSFKGFYYLLDDTVFGRPKSYPYYRDLYQRIAGLKKVKLWTGQANLDAAGHEEGREVIRRAARAGLTYAAIGMESINPAVLERAGTIAKQGAGSADDVIARMKEHIRFIQDQGILISGWFTIGYEEDSPETFYETLAFCREMNLIPILCPLEALPGTPLYQRLDAEGRVDNGRAPNIVHPTMSSQDLLAALADATAKGFTMGEIMRRTWFFGGKARRAAQGFGQKLEATLKKTGFAFKLQNELKKGIIGFANMENAR